MYTLLFFVFVLSGVLLLIKGVHIRRRVVGGAGIALLLAGLLLFPVLEFVAEMLWFGELGFGQRFWTVVFARVGVGVTGALVGAAVVFLLTLPVGSVRRRMRFWPAGLGMVAGLLMGLSHWQTVLVFLNRVESGVSDPVLGRDVGFYLFALPFYDALVSFLAGLCLISLLGALAGTLLRRTSEGLDIVRLDPKRVEPADYAPVGLPAGALLWVWAGWWLLRRFHLLTSSFGTVNEAGWADVMVRMPVFAVMAAVAALAGLVLAVPHLRTAVARAFSSRPAGLRSDLRVLGGTAVVLVVVWFGGAGALPAVFQWLYVSPNEITAEEPYIRHNIDFTRRAFGVHRIQDRELHAQQAFTEQVASRNQQLLDDVRLWDWRALQAVYRQFQEGGYPLNASGPTCCVICQLSVDMATAWYGWLAGFDELDVHSRGGRAAPRPKNGRPFHLRPAGRWSLTWGPGQ